MFPREPRNRKRAQKGNVSKVQTLYYEKDIRFLLHEPIVWKFREFKVLYFKSCFNIVMSPKLGVSEKVEEGFRKEELGHC